MQVFSRKFCEILRKGHQIGLSLVLRSIEHAFKHIILILCHKSFTLEIIYVLITQLKP